VFDFAASRHGSEVRRESVLPVAASVGIHATAVVLLLTLTFSDRFVERPRPTTARAMILLAPPPAIHTVPHDAHRTVRTPPRLFRAPVVGFVTAQRRELKPVPAPQIPLLEVARPLLPQVEVARLPVAPPPALRTDNLAPLATRAPAATNTATSRTSAVLRSSGFEQISIETPPRPRALPLLKGEFADATMAPAVQPQRAAVAPALPVTRSVEILSKPRPAYTAEARRLRIEGEVLLDILFAASGEVRVLRIVRGLSHGLDENAIAAAEAIRFRPAERAGMAADSTAIVHIVFQLAY
jgi:TonB family protein